MTSNATPEPKAAPQSAPAADSRASADATQLESSSKAKVKTKASAGAKTTSKSKSKSRAGNEPNNVRKLRQAAMMSKAELARRAGVSPLTIDRVEAGCPCRMDTKRKILEALGLSPSARAEVWPGIDEQS